MSEEEVAKRGLPDYLKPGLDIVFIGINPSMFAAYTGKYYDGPGNHFWQALYLSGILSEPMSAVDDHKLLDLGIGFTNIVPRTTRGLSDLSRKEIADGAEVIILAQHDMKFITQAPGAHATARGTSILGEVRNVEIPGATQQLQIVNLMIF